MAALKLTCLACGQANRIPAEKLTQRPICGTCGAALADGTVQEVDPQTLDKAARTDDLPLVVDFWAPWCGPCKMMAPGYVQAAKALQGAARLVKLNTEDHPQAGAKHRIRGIPTLAVFRAGKEVAREAGARPAAAIEAWVRQNG